MATTRHSAAGGDVGDELRGQRHDRLQDGEKNESDIRRRNSSKTTPSQPTIDTHVSILQKMLSATCGSLVTSLLVTPLDVVRVRLQAQQTTSTTSSARPSISPNPLNSFRNLPPDLGVTACCREVFWVQNTSRLCVTTAGVPALSTLTSAPSGAIGPTAAAEPCPVEASQQRNFTSTFDGLRKIARNEGPLTLWRGLSPTLLMAIPANVIYFAGYDFLRSSPTSPIGAHSPLGDAYAPLAAGSLARVLAAIAVSPIEMLRTRMQAASLPTGGTGPISPGATSSTGSGTGSGTGIFRETLRGLRTMVSSDGYRSLWRGLTLTLWRDVPFSALYWWGYEAARERLAALHRGPGAFHAGFARHDHAALLLESFGAGAAAGAAAALVTTPFDVGKTRQQVLERAAESAGPAGGPLNTLPPEQRSMTRFLWHIFREEGASGLFRGWAARCLKVAPACAIMISSYEIGKKMAGEVNERKEHEGE